MKDKTLCDAGITGRKELIGNERPIDDIINSRSMIASYMERYDTKFYHIDMSYTHIYIFI